MMTDVDLMQAMKAFERFTLTERRETLRTFADLQFPSLDDRFFEAVYRVIQAQDTAPSFERKGKR